MTDYLCSYKPLCITAEGRQAAHKHHLPPFVDHSCRREPDLTAAWPTISSLCRAGKFAPKLQLGDRVAYMTCKADFGAGVRVRYLVACLRVIRRFESHADAAAWYKAQLLDLPSNLIIAGNPPLTAANTAYPEQCVKDWDSVYRYRAEHWGAFLLCHVDCMNVFGPPLISEPELKTIFRRVPGTQNPGRITATQYQKLIRHLSNSSGSP